MKGGAEDAEEKRVVAGATKKEKTASSWSRQLSSEIF
jgi:hypothetical protein